MGVAGLLLNCDMALAGGPKRETGEEKQQASGRASGSRYEPLLARDIHLYRVCEIISEVLILAMIIFSPWALGTTQPWAIWTMNTAAYLLGLMLLCKLTIRHFKNYNPARWLEIAGDKEVHGCDGTLAPRPFRPPCAGGCIIQGLLILTCAILAYCLVSALNARQVYNETAGFFEDLRRAPWLTKWLPSSLDRSRSWLAFWNYLALACAFWAIHDWLLGKTESEAAERRFGVATDLELSGAAVHSFPGRLRRLLWVLAINGGLIALESIVQRLAGSSKLLFMVQPQVNPLGETQFGPYAYRSNAAQYFNLIWPVCLGFWWIQQRASRFKNRRAHLLLICCVVMAGGSIISTSRGGALVAIGMLIAGLIALAVITFVFPRNREEERSGRLALRWVAVCATVALAIGLGFGWKTLRPRMAALGEGFTDRELMYDAARPMARDYRLFGTGPGTFERVFQLYRFQTSTYWPAQLHNDWLETRITFGLIGTSLILIELGLVVLRWFAPGGIHGGRGFMIMVWLALGGCFVHARYDFPLQIYSVLFTFLVLCACMSVLSRR